MSKVAIIAASLIELAKIEESAEVEALEPVRNAIAAKLRELRAEAAAEGAHLWVCEWTAELRCGDIAAPGDVRKYIVPSRRWPKAAAGETVIFNDKAHRVVFNNAVKNADGWHQVNFAIYAIIPV